MTNAKLAAEGVHLAVLGIWVGVLGMSGAAAAVVFPTMRRLEPVLPGFMDYLQDHDKIAGGQIMQRVFVIGDFVQMLLAGIAAITLAIAIRRRPPLAAARGVVMGAVLAVLGYKAFVLDPRMGTNLSEFWLLAEAGRTAEATTRRLAFDADHPRASNVLSITAGLVLVLLMLGIASMSRAGSRGRTGS